MADSDGPRAERPLRVPLALEVQGLGKRVALPEGALTILEDVDFAVERGDAVAIVGASGSGKSTLLSLLAGLDTPSTGSVHLDGAPLSTLDEDGRARVRGEKVGFVFQSFQLLPTLTALENVMLPVLLNGTHIPDARKRAQDLLESVGLGHRLEHKPGELSGGERQRAAVARALVNKPACVLGDEPTGNLDEKTAAHVFAQMLDLNHAQRTSLVLVTHDRKLARRLDRVLELHEGKLRELAPSEV